MISVLAYLAEKHWSLGKGWGNSGLQILLQTDNLNLTAVDPDQTELNSLQEIAEKERAKREVQIDQTRDLFDRIKSFKTEVKSVTKREPSSPIYAFKYYQLSTVENWAQSDTESESTRALWNGPVWRKNQSNP